MKFVYASFLLSVLLGSAQGSDDSEKQMTCADTSRRWNANGGERTCEIRETILTSVPSLNVLAANGGITVRGWSQNTCLIRSKIDTWAPSKSEARALAAQIEVVRTDATVTAKIPPSKRDQGSAVTYEIFLPHETDISLKAGNGGMIISGIKGQITFDAGNGGVVLSRLGGRVRGAVANGGLKIELAGPSWDGDGLDVTASGGILFEIPSNYSARLELRTTNGKIAAGFQTPSHLGDNGDTSVVLGAGGPLLRAISQNGRISLLRSL